MASRIVGLKDSSGDMAYAREAAKIAADFDVFPSTEAGADRSAQRNLCRLHLRDRELQCRPLCQRAWGSGDSRCA